MSTFSNPSNRQKISSNQGLISSVDSRVTITESKIVDLNTSLVGVEAKLNGSASILSEGGVDYSLDSLLTHVVENKAKLSVFTSTLNGAVGDADAGVITLMEQVAQNKADVSGATSRIASEEALQASNHLLHTQAIADESTARVSAIADAKASTDAQFATNFGRLGSLDASMSTLSTSVSLVEANSKAYTDSAILTATTPFAIDVATKMHTIADSRLDYFVVEGEGAEPQFSCGSVPMEADFGLPITKQSLLQTVDYICLSPDGSITGSHSMNLDIQLWGASGNLVATSPLSFSGRKLHMGGLPIPMEAGGNVVVKYNSKTGMYPEGTRFRVVLGFHALDIDVIKAM
jgi:hypothetical protein